MDITLTFFHSIVAILGHNCPWSISGSNEERMLAEIKQHGQAKHNAISISEEDEQKIRRAIRKQAA